MSKPIGWKNAIFCLSLLAFESCTSDRRLDEMPKPGLVGKPEFDAPADRPSEHIMRFVTRASETEMRSAFETYCTKLGLHKRTDPGVLQGETWCESAVEGLGIAISPSAKDNTLHVSVFRRS